MTDRAYLARRFLALAERVERHDCGWCAMANTFFGAFRIGGPIGGTLDRAANVFGYLRVLAEDEAWKIGLNPNSRSHDPSPVAARMMAAEAPRQRDRRVRPMPAAAREAVLAYLREELDILDEAAALIRHARGAEFKRRIARCRRVAEKLLAAMDERPEFGSRATHAPGPHLAESPR